MTEQMFFDKYPRFYNSEVGSQPVRLDYRYKAIIQNNLNIIENAEIIDLGSYDGRWAFAALKNGAKSVLGCEGRQSLVDLSFVNLGEYNDNDYDYDFVLLNIDTQSHLITGKYDVGFVLGILYHTANNFLILKRLAQLGIRHLIIDTRIVKNDEPIMYLRVDSEKPENLGSCVSSRASIPALELMLNYLGFNDLLYFDWSQFPACDGTHDYSLGNRITIRASR
jgi:hypothetical protein